MKNSPIYHSKNIRIQLSSLSRISINILLLLIETQLIAQNISITNVNPSPNTHNVSPDANIVISFDQTIAASTLNNTSVLVRGSQTGVITGNLSGGGTSGITFDSDNEFKPGELISVTITSSLQSESTFNLIYI